MSGRTREQLAPITIDISDACSLIGVSRTKLYELMANNDIASVKLGKRRLVVMDSLRKYLSNLPSAGLSGPKNPRK